MDAIPTILFLGAIAAGVALWVFALVDLVRVPGTALRTGTKALWLLIVLVGQGAGALLYLVFARPRSQQLA